MKAIWYLGISSLAGRRSRHALLVVAIALAGSLTVSAAAVLGTMHASLTQAVGQMTGRSDVTVRHRFGDRISTSLLGIIHGWPEVEVASGRFGTGTTLVNSKARRKASVAAVGVDTEFDEFLNPLRLLKGRRVHRPAEIALDEPVATRLKVGVGDRVEIRSGGRGDLITGLADSMLGYRRNVWSSDPGMIGTIQCTVVGIIGRPQLKILQRPTGYVTLEQARQLAGMRGRLDTIHLKLKPDVDAEWFRTRYDGALPPEIMFQTAAGLSTGVNRTLNGIRLTELVINLLVMLSSIFLILTGLTTAVEQRQRELATMRSVGASRIQIAGSQLFSGMTITLLAAALAVPLGLSLGYWLYTDHRESMVAGFRPDMQGVTMAVAAMLLAGLIGALYPAYRAVRVSPMAALCSEASRSSPWGIFACLITGVVCAMVQPLVFLLPIDNQMSFRFYIFVGIGLTMVGYFLLSIPLLLLVNASLVPLLAHLLRVPPSLMRQTIGETPYRHGFTGASLMIGVALLVGVWTGGRSIMADWFADVKMPDGFAHSLFPLTDAQWHGLKRSKVITAACPTSAFPVRIDRVQFGTANLTPPQTLFTSFDPQTFFAMADLDWVQGDPETALARLDEGRAVLVSREYLIAHDIGVGDKIKIETTIFGPVDFDVVGVIASPGLDVAVNFFGIHRYYADTSVSTIFGSRADARTYFRNEAINLVLLQFVDHLEDHQVIRRLAKDVPGTIVGSARQIREFVEFMSRGLLSTATTIAIAMLVIACFGVGNIIIANLTARQFEYGVLRAIGGHRWMLGRLIIAETLTMALVGGILGAGLGIQFAMIDREFLRRLYGWIYDLTLPWNVVIIAIAASIFFAFLAALPAAWHIAHIEPRRLLASRR